jgi:divalent anion:Na+ symporter, DASS family
MSQRKRRTDHNVSPFISLHFSTTRAPRCCEEAAADLKTYLATATARTPVRALRVPREALAKLGLASRAMLALTSHLSGEAPLPAPKPAAAPPAAPVPRKELAGWLAVLLAPPLL